MPNGSESRKQKGERMLEELKTAQGAGLSFVRLFTKEEKDAFTTVEWEKRTSQITDAAGNVIFEQKDVEVPKDWSATATNIVASKYLHGVMGTKERETGVRALVKRVVETITDWGAKDGYFRTVEDEKAFYQELAYVLLHQYAAFNSPVWFNVGCHNLDPDSKAANWHWDYVENKVLFDVVGYKRPQCSACFINSVKDDMASILELAKTEGMLFKWGSGTGTNLSSLRASNERLSGGGTASGPLSFMKGFDAFAGVIKSGGKTRRAAKMVILNVDHPDVEEFIDCKLKEEQKAYALMQMGYDGSHPDAEAYSSIFFQNANNSIRVTDEFMTAVENDREFETRYVKTGATAKTYKARDLMKKIATAAHACGDPGIQFDSTINEWHTCKASGRINASNPCSEYMFLDDSACNLASLNLLKFAPNGTFDLKKFKHVVDLLVTAQDILVDNAGYPTETIAKNSHDYRPLGLGFANLGGLLMSLGLPYDSDAGRAYAACVASVMTGEAYAQSGRLAATLNPVNIATDLLLAEVGDKVTGGACPGWYLNKGHFTNVIKKHHRQAMAIPVMSTRLVPEDLRLEAEDVWEETYNVGKHYGFRNAQVSVLAPTGTIGFMMDCDTTGIEPDLGLVKFKKLVGGGFIKIVNRTVFSGLSKLGYQTDQVNTILDYVERIGTIEGAPFLQQEHLQVFDCSLKPENGERSIRPMGHVAMMAAVQPFISGAISKTVNMPNSATPEDIAKVYQVAWKSGVKAIAVYRDGCKKSQPVVLKRERQKVAEAEDLSGPPKASRHKLPKERSSITHKFKVGDHEGYVTVGMYPNGRPGEIFITMSKEGSTLSGVMDSFALAISMALQHGVPLDLLCEKFEHVRFEPSGWSGDPEIGFANSIMDYLFRWIRKRFLKQALQKDEPKAPEKEVPTDDAPICSTCGTLMTRNGTCFKCANCGGTSGCS